MLVAALGGAAQAKQCPGCGNVILKATGGGDAMMCGCEARDAGGTLAMALRLGGCGHEFSWSTLAPLRYGEPGHPANERQWKFLPGAATGPEGGGSGASDGALEPEPEAEVLPSRRVVSPRLTAAQRQHHLRVHIVACLAKGPAPSTLKRHLLAHYRNVDERLLRMSRSSSRVLRCRWSAG
jgi:hypothetical protein